ncbi:MAG: VOC family protein [Tissierellia bacterium]|nr:VOC family protein [Tissierellia bacterium]
MSKFHESPNKYVNHVVLKVSNIEKSIEFYENILGFKSINRENKKVEISADGINPILTLEEPENVKPKELRRTGLYHFALLMPSRKELGKILKHIRDLNYPLIGASHHGISEAIYLQDIDDNGIEIYADTPVSSWQWRDDQLDMPTRRLDLESIIEEGKGEEFKSIHPKTIIGHIHLHVADLEEAERFYVDGLGFNVVSKIPRQAIFTSTGGYHHHIAFNVWNGIGIPAPSKDSVGMKYYSIKLPDEKERLKTVDNLVRLGYEVNSQAGNIITFDPSENEIHLVI